MYKDVVYVIIAFILYLASLLLLSEFWVLNGLKFIFFVSAGALSFISGITRIRDWGFVNNIMLFICAFTDNYFPEIINPYLDSDTIIYTFVTMNLSLLLGYELSKHFLVARRKTSRGEYRVRYPKFTLVKRWMYKFLISTVGAWTILYIFGKGHVLLAVICTIIGVFIVLTM